MILLLAILCWTSSQPVTVPVEKIKRAAEDYVTERLASDHGEYFIEFRAIPSNITVESDDYSVRVRVSSVPRLRGHLSLPVEIICAKKVERRLVVPIYLRTFGNVLLLGKQLNRHESIDLKDVSLQRVETTDLPDDVISDEKATKGMRAVRIITPQTILCRTMMERIPDVKPDDLVTLAIRTDKTKITIQGVSKEEGRIGDAITVQRLGSHERLRGIVLDAKNVLIDVDGTSRVNQERR